MKMLWVVAACAALSAPATAQVRVIDDGRSESNAELKPAADGKKICKTRVVTGSRVSKAKECRTPEEWEKVHVKGKAVADDLVRKSTSFNCVMFGNVGSRQGCAGG